MLRQVLRICCLIAALGGTAFVLAADAPATGTPATTEAPPANPAVPASNTAMVDALPVSKDLVLKGDAQCTVCHDENSNPQMLAIARTKHGTLADVRTPTCTDCHGDSGAHVNNPGGGGDRPAPDRTFSTQSRTPIAARNDACLNCHQGGKRIHWAGGPHANHDIACTSCHQVHHHVDKVRQKITQSEVCFTCHKEQRAQIDKLSHHPLVEGKMTCTSCHEVHGDNPKLMARGSVNDTCYTCHMEKRGPFVHNHQPVTEDCSICHNPHGTNIASLLKARPPFLCQECHSHTSHPGQAGALPSGMTNSTSLLGAVGRGCLNCHTNIHGGNSTVNSATAGRFRR
ncbi:MAG: DmsE family decaheme c-type cytochrome [Pseudomonadota bacterium]